MKKILTQTFFIIGFAGLLIISCKEKNNNSITPTYRSQSTGTGANPTIKTVKNSSSSINNNPSNSPQEQR
jgi:hypothetical protein